MTDCFAIWPEEQPPASVVNCTDCGLDQHGTRLVWGEGNPEAPIMILLDNPGAREDREGRPYICGTRKTLQAAARSVDMSSEDLYVTYVLKRRPVRAYDKPAARAECMKHLFAQIEHNRPQFIFCLGNVAVQQFFSDPEAEVKSLRQHRHNVRGIDTVVSYHPLAVRRRPNLNKVFLEDWHYLSQWFKQA